ncbi:MAG: SAM-dependent methyltransferase, partial [Bdellovibrionales bacterium]|nr:SAM-dependent methyltransferase [Bdellovibrionales bacterium]
MLKEKLVFFQEFLTHFDSVGSIIPSSRWAAEALTTQMRKRTQPIKILEVGPGTGPVTVKILENMRAGDKFTICEINPRLMELLKVKLQKHPQYDAHRENIDFFLGPVQELPEKIQYDVIVCAIPFNNLPIAVIEEIFLKLKRLSHTETSLSFFEYLGVRSLGKIVSSSKRKAALEDIQDFYSELKKA